jgi:hypothetical protein
VLLNLSAPVLSAIDSICLARAHLHLGGARFPKIKRRAEKFQIIYIYTYLVLANLTKQLAHSCYRPKPRAVGMAAGKETPQLGGDDNNAPDALGRVRTTYPNGSTYSIFKSDGSGTVNYSNGVFAVNVTAGDGIPPGLYTTIFSNKGKCDAIGSWDCLGVGSCRFPNGRVRLCTTMQGGSEYSEVGAWNFHHGVHDDKCDDEWLNVHRRGI